jgi:ketosteroid isomerase-like protein
VSATALSTFDSLRDASERRDADALVALYADDAVLVAYDKDHPPSRPQEFRGRASVEAFLRDICAREMTHEVGDQVIGEDRIAFIERCEYPDGTRVVAETFCELRDGQIAREVLTQAWDA